MIPLFYASGIFCNRDVALLGGAAPVTLLDPQVELS